MGYPRDSIHVITHTTVQQGLELQLADANLRASVPVVLTREELRGATGSFASAGRIGVGGFGVVYRAENLPSLRPVAYS